MARSDVPRPQGGLASHGLFSVDGQPDEDHSGVAPSSTDAPEEAPDLEVGLEVLVQDDVEPSAEDHHGVERHDVDLRRGLRADVIPPEIRGMAPQRTVDVEVPEPPGGTTLETAAQSGLSRTDRTSDIHDEASARA